MLYEIGEQVAQGNLEECIRDNKRIAFNKTYKQNGIIISSHEIQQNNDICFLEKSNKENRSDSGSRCHDVDFLRLYASGSNLVSNMIMIGFNM